MSDTDDPIQYKLKYEGNRFSGAKLPLDVLGDFQAFRDLLVETVRQKWLVQNPDRKRVPRGFDSSLNFVLADIEDGSAMPVFRLEHAEVQSKLPNVKEELHSLVGSAFGDLAKLLGSGNTANLTKAQLSRLNKFGAGLQSGEKIVFVTVNNKTASNNDLFIDVDRRRSLLTRSQNSTYFKRCKGTAQLLGSKISSSQDSIGFIFLETEDFGSLSIPLENDQILNDFENVTGYDVEFDILAELNQDNTISKIKEVYDLCLVEDYADDAISGIIDRIRSLQYLKAGWLDDSAGLAIEKTSRLQAEKFVKSRHHIAPHCNVFPTESGGVSVEINTSIWDLTVEFSGGKVSIYGIKNDGTDFLQTTVFDVLNESFYALFDSKVSHG